MFHVMVRALNVERISNSSSTNKLLAMTVDETANFIIDKDVHRCKVCGDTDPGTIGPKLLKKRRKSLDDFEYPNYCKGCFEWSQGVSPYDSFEALCRSFFFAQ